MIGSTANWDIFYKTVKSYYFTGVWNYDINYEIN